MLIRSAIDCVLIAGFMMGNMWVFGGRPPSSCPCLCRMVVLVLTVGFVSWAVPVIVCTGLFCCIPPVVRALQTEDDEDYTDDDHHHFSYIHNKLISKAGASEAAIHALPFHTYAAAQGRPSSPQAEDSFPHSSTSGKAKMMSACCICLARYAEGVQVRELPCSHKFHMECVDKWLRINAMCPLCKHEINQFAPEELLF